MSTDNLKSNLLSSKHWLRLIFMILFALVLQLAALVMWAIVILQFLFSLITGQDNRNLRRAGHSLSLYIYHTLRFLTYTSEEKPFPFSDWPNVDVEGVSVAGEKPKSRARASGSTQRSRTHTTRAKKPAITKAPEPGIGTGETGAGETNSPNS